MLKVLKSLDIKEIISSVDVVTSKTSFKEVNKVSISYYLPILITVSVGDGSSKIYSST